MKAPVIIILFLILAYQVNGQSKSVRFQTLDKVTEEPIPGVRAVPVMGGDTGVSDNKGRLIIQVPEHYKDSVLFLKDHYSPYKTNIHVVPPGKYIPVYLLPLNRADSGFINGKKGNDPIWGQVFNANFKEPVPNAAVHLNNGTLITHSDVKGKYQFTIDRSKGDAMVISAEGYQEREIQIKRINNTGLIPLGKTEQDVFKEQYINAISLSVLELFRGAVAIRYERFLKEKQAIGLHSSLYFFNKNITTDVIFFSDVLDISEFDGIKISPFYRYYQWRGLHFAGFFEAKPIIGYFSFPGFNNSNVPEDESVEFWTGGAGLAFGFMIQSGHFIMNTSIGGQYLPVTKSLPAAASGRADDNWWYYYGPGSYFELKLTIGGIFKL